jgi:NAD(P)-dependent dehydrogenase (short-subunit alcohol dehydrogenase family)
VHTVLANVTDPAALQAMADRIEAENPKGLYALVNNAGTTETIWKCRDAQGKDTRQTPDVSVRVLGLTRTGAFDWLSVSDYKAVM